MTVCDKLVNFEVTREQLLEEDTTKVDSTTKCNPPEKRRKVEKQAKVAKLQKIAAAEAARERARAMFSAADDSDSDIEPEELYRQLSKQKHEIQELQKKLQQQRSGECTHICCCMCVLLMYIISFVFVTLAN